MGETCLGGLGPASFKQNIHLVFSPAEILSIYAGPLQSVSVDTSSSL